MPSEVACAPAPCSGATRKAEASLKGVSNSPGCSLRRGARSRRVGMQDTQPDEARGVGHRLVAGFQLFKHGVKVGIWIDDQLADQLIHHRTKHVGQKQCRPFGQSMLFARNAVGDALAPGPIGALGKARELRFLVAELEDASHQSGIGAADGDPLPIGIADGVEGGPFRCAIQAELEEVLEQGRQDL